MHYVTIYRSDTAAVFSLNDQGLKTYAAKLKKDNMLVPLKNIYELLEKWRPQEWQTGLNQIPNSSSPTMASNRCQ